MVHVAFVITLPVHLFASVKSVVSLTLAPLTTSAPAPVFVTVKLTGATVAPATWVPKLMLLAESETSATVPLPVSAAACGLAGALSATLIAAARLPAAVGANFTLTMQDAAAPKLAGQLFVCAKSLEFAPVSVIPLTPSVPLPVFESVMLCAALVVPTDCAPKFRLAGDSAIPGEAPVPDSVTICGLPLALSLMLKFALCAPLDAGAK